MAAPSLGTAFSAVISTRFRKNRQFSRLFCDFSLRSAITLAIVAAARVFSVKNRGSQLAACFDRIGVERKIRRISRLDGSQATEQDQGCGTHRRESRHTEENRRSILLRAVQARSEGSQELS